MNTRGIHWIVTTHGSWLHGDPRGSWRDGQLLGPDPFLESAVRARMDSRAVVLTDDEQDHIAAIFGERCQRRGWRVHAATFHPTHAHLVFAPMPDDIRQVIAELKAVSARAVLRRRRETGVPTGKALWTARPFPRFIFHDGHLANAIEYVRRHNRRVGRPDDPYPWITP